MAIYRPPKARWPLAIAAGAVSLAIGLGIGVLIGDDELDPGAAAAQVRSELISAAGSLEVAAVEYEESVSDGEVTRRAEYEGALDALASSEDRYGDVAPALETLAPARADDISSAYVRCGDLMADLADPSEVGGCLSDLGNLLSEGE